MLHIAASATSSSTIPPLSDFAPLFVGCFALSLILCILIIILSKHTHIFIDSHTSSKPQRFHTQATPRAGGIGIFVALCVIIIDFSFVELLTLQQCIFFLLCSGAIFASGLIEDFSGSLSPKLRLMIQCAGVFILCLTLDIMLYDLSFGFSLPYLAALCLTLFALVGVINAMNIIDGFNGLASGISLLVLTSIIVMAYQLQDYNLLFLSIGFMCCVLGFFICNFPFGKIFLGDGGAYFLGFMLGILLVILTQRHADSISAFFGLMVMIYPVWEVLFTIWRRKRIKQKAMYPDNAHLHTLLFQRIGHNALTSVFLCIIQSVIVIFALCFYAHTWILLSGIGVFIFAYLILYSYLKQQI